MIGLLLVAVAVVLALETKSLLLGEAADPRGAAADPRRARGHATGSTGVIHMKTLHLGPGGAAGRGQDRRPRREARAAEVAASHRRGRARRSASAEPTARVIYLEPDIYVGATSPTRGRSPEPAGTDPRDRRRRRLVGGRDAGSDDEVRLSHEIVVRRPRTHVVR